MKLIIFPKPMSSDKSQSYVLFFHILNFFALVFVQNSLIRNLT